MGAPLIRCHCPLAAAKFGLDHGLSALLKATSASPCSDRLIVVRRNHCVSPVHPATVVMLKGATSVCSILRNLPTFQRVVPPNLRGAGILPAAAYRHAVGTAQPNSAATTRTSTYAASGKESNAVKALGRVACGMVVSLLVRGAIRKPSLVSHRAVEIQRSTIRILIVPMPTRNGRILKKLSENLPGGANERPYVVTCKRFRPINCCRSNKPNDTVEGCTEQLAHDAG
jgi:hypothetical protein